MKLCVVTVCYNDLEALKKTINSALAQSVDDFEMVIQDGGSTDGTLEFLKSLDHKQIRYHSEKDRGIYDGMNRGVANSSSEYIYFLNAGDVFYDEKVVEDLNRLLSTDPSIVFSKVLCVSSDYQMIKGRPVKEKDFRFGMPISHQGVIYRKSDLISEPYDLKYRIVSDLKLTKRILKKHNQSTYFNRTICRFDLSGISSIQHFRMLKERMMLASEGQDWGAMLYCIFIDYPKYSLIRLLRILGVYNWMNSIRFKKHL